jgi:hypothetical protein
MPKSEYQIMSFIAVWPKLRQLYQMPSCAIPLSIHFLQHVTTELALDSSEEVKIVLAPNKLLLNLNMSVQHSVFESSLNPHQG